QCLQLAERVEVPPGSRCYVPIRTGVDYLFSMYCPRDWGGVDVVRPGMKLTVIVVDNNQALAPSVPGLRKGRGYLLAPCSGQTVPLPERGDLHPNAWVFWYPEFTRLRLSGQEQNAYVEGSGCVAWPQHARYQVKFDVTSHLHCYIFLPRRPGESRGVAEVV